MDQDPIPPEPRGGRLVLQLFLIPLAVVVVCVGIFFLFSLLTFEHKSPADYLADVKGAPRGSGGNPPSSFRVRSPGFPRGPSARSSRPAHSRSSFTSGANGPTSAT